VELERTIWAPVHELDTITGIIFRRNLLNMKEEQGKGIGLSRRKHKAEGKGEGAGPGVGTYKVQGIFNLLLQTPNRDTGQGKRRGNRRHEWLVLTHQI